MSGCAPPTPRSGSGILGLPAELWLARPEVGPLPSFGACIVASCAAAAANRSGMCGAHSIAWCRHRRDHGGAVLAEWARHAAPADVAGHEVVLRGLPERVIAELLAGLQRRTDAGLRTLPTSTRCLVKLLHARQAGSVLDLARVPGAEIRPDARQLLRCAGIGAVLPAVRAGEGAGQGRLAASGVRAARQAGLHRHQPAVAARGRQVVGGRGPSPAPRPGARRLRPGHHPRGRGAVAEPAPVPRRRRASPRRARPTGHHRVRQPDGAPAADRGDDPGVPAAADPPHLPAPQRRARPGDDRPRAKPPPAFPPPSSCAAATSPRTPTGSPGRAACPTRC